MDIKQDINDDYVSDNEQENTCPHCNGQIECEHVSLFPNEKHRKGVKRKQYGVHIEEEGEEKKVCRKCGTRLAPGLNLRHFLALF
jgi:hypothetical protein